MLQFDNQNCLSDPPLPLYSLNDATQAQLATLIAQGSATADDLTAVTASIEATTKQITDDLAKTVKPA